MEEIIKKIKRKGIPLVVILVFGIIGLFGLFMPYERSIGDAKEYLKSNPDQVAIEEVGFKNSDIVNVSIMENFKIYRYTMQNSNGDDYAYGESLINVIITVVLIVSIVLVMLFAWLNKKVLIIIFDIVMAICSLLMNIDIVDRGVMPSEAYTYGISYYLYIILAIVILAAAIFAFIYKNKVDDNVVEETKKTKKLDIKKSGISEIVKGLDKRIVLGVFAGIVVILVCIFVIKGCDKNVGDSSITGSTTKEVYSNAESEANNFVSTLESEWKELSDEIDTYDKYKNNQEKVKDFYEKIVQESEDFSIKCREYALKYAQIIVNSNKSMDDMYEDLEDIYDDIYDGILDVLYDDIYDGLLDDMYDYYYDGILDDDYSLSSKEYKNYSNATSDVYSAYSSATSDVYSFYSSLRSALYKENLNEAKEIIEDFSEDIEKLK